MPPFLKPMNKQKVTLEGDPTGTGAQKRPGNENLQGQKAVLAALWKVI